MAETSVANGNGTHALNVEDGDGNSHRPSQSSTKTNQESSSFGLSVPFMQKVTLNYFSFSYFLAQTQLQMLCFSFKTI